MDVLLVAVKKDKILNHTNVLAQAGKSPAVVDIDAFGLQNCYEYNYQPHRANGSAAEHRRERDEHQHCARGIPLFTRDVSVGGNQYTDSLQKELDLSFEDAEPLKTAETLERQRRESSRSCAGNGILALEIQKTFDFFRATASGENIQRI